MKASLRAEIDEELLRKSRSFLNAEMKSFPERVFFAAKSPSSVIRFNISEERISTGYVFSSIFFLKEILYHYFFFFFFQAFTFCITSSLDFPETVSIYF